MSRSQFGGDKITISKLYFQETGVFQDVYAAPLELNMKDGADDLIRDRLMGAGEGKLTGKAFSGIGARVLAPVIEVDKRRDRIHVPDGWDRERCRFSMEVQIERRLGGEETIYLHGFTDHMGLSAAGSIDPDMELFVNGFIRVGYAEQETRYGMEIVPVVKEIAQVAAGKLIFERDMETHSTRPNDIFGNMQRALYDSGTSVPLTDNRTRVRSPNDALFSFRRHNLAGDYLAETLQSFRNALAYQNYGNDRTDIVGMAQQRLNSGIEMMRDNPFLRAIGQLRGENMAVSFTIDDLMELDRNVGHPDVMKGMELSARARGALATRENCSRWDDATLQAQWARQISSGLSAIIMQRYHRGINFTASNMTGTGKIEVIPGDSAPVVDNLPLYFFENMMDDIEDFLLDLSHGNRIDFDMEVEVSQYDQTRILLTIGLDREELFYVPSFADALLAPVYTRRQAAVEDIVNDFTQIIESCTSELAGVANGVADGM